MPKSKEQLNTERLLGAVLAISTAVDCLRAYDSSQEGEEGGAHKRKIVSKMEKLQKEIDRIINH